MDAVIMQCRQTAMTSCVRIFTNVRDGLEPMGGIKVARSQVIFRENLPSERRGSRRKRRGGTKAIAKVDTSAELAVSPRGESTVRKSAADNAGPSERPKPRAYLRYHSCKSPEGHVDVRRVTRKTTRGIGFSTSGRITGHLSQ